MTLSVSPESCHTDGEYNDQKQAKISSSSRRVPSNWLSLPIVEHISVRTAPPCSKDIRDKIYHPISQNPQRFKIRLIEIEDKNDERGRMSCSLQSYTLNKAPRFCALSYCWEEGSASAGCKSILVNGFEFRVQSNLWNALQMLRRHSYTTLWVDAICLNQQDEGEKAHQVPRIRLIYQKAEKVVVWLGNESDYSKEFLDSLRTIGKSDCMQAIHERQDSENPLYRDENRSVYPADVRKDLIQALLSQQTKGKLEIARGITSNDKRDATWMQICEEFQTMLCAFFARPYWRRTWVVQEIASARKIRVLCGTSKVSWEDLTSLLIFDDGTLYWGNDAATGSQNMSRIEKLRYKVSQGISIGFLTALQRSYGCEAGDRRDKFYALHGLCWNAGQLMPSISYEEDATVNSIMFDLMRRWINSGCLDVICLQPHIQDDHSLPSWLPKWLTVGRSTMDERLVDHIENRRAVAFCSTHGHSWTATKSSLSLPRFADSNRIMRVKGTIIDMIDGLSAACDHFWRDSRLQKYWHSRSQAPANMERVKNICYDLYWTLNMYKERDGNCPSDQKLKLDILFSEETKKRWQSAGFDCHITWLEELRNFKIFGQPFHRWLLDRPEYQDQAKVKTHSISLRHTEHRVIPTLHDEKLLTAFGQVFDDLRRLMTTMGDRVGWAHPSARPDDLIVLLEGCNLPVILRRLAMPFHNHQTYAVVGDAYVHGIMRGELWEKASQRLSHIYLR